MIRDFITKDTNMAGTHNKLIVKPEPYRDKRIERIRRTKLETPEEKVDEFRYSEPFGCKARDG